MAKRIVVDPVTRIEGHLRIDCEVDGGKVTNAWSSGQMWRGFEVILQGPGTHGCSLSASAGSERQSTHWLQCVRLKMPWAWRFLLMPNTSAI